MYICDFCVYNRMLAKTFEKNKNVRHLFCFVFVAVAVVDFPPLICFLGIFVGAIILRMYGFNRNRSDRKKDSFYYK